MPADIAQDLLSDPINLNLRARRQIEFFIERIITEQGKEFRRVMPLAAKETKGRADGARVQRMVKELTQ